MADMLTQLLVDRVKTVSLDGVVMVGFPRTALEARKIENALQEFFGRKMFRVLVVEMSDDEA